MKAQTMKAAVRYKYGMPDVLEVAQVKKPQPKPNEILVKVYASSVNRTDDGFLRGKPFIARFFSGLPKPRQPILGCEFAGEVTQIGENVSEFELGDRVFGFDDATWGGHGEYMTIKARKSVAKIPQNISYEQAAASTEGAHYAMSYLYTMKKLGAQRVFVHGATGAIGSAAVQLLKQAGMYVVTTSTTKNMKLVESLGADDVIDWEKNDFTKYSGDRFDIVFDSVGKSTFAECKSLLKKRGVYIATEFGPYGQNPFLAIISPLNKILGLKRVLFPLPLNKKEIIEHIAKCLDDGSFKPVIDTVYQLSDIQKAYKYVETGQKTGNVVIRIQ